MRAWLHPPRLERTATDQLARQYRRSAAKIRAAHGVHTATAHQHRAELAVIKAALLERGETALVAALLEEHETRIRVTARRADRASHVDLDARLAYLHDTIHELTRQAAA